MLTYVHPAVGVFLKGLFTPTRGGLPLVECLMDTQGAEKFDQDGEVARFAGSDLEGLYDFLQL